MRITKNYTLNCARFGCAFLPKRNLVCIPWQHDQQTAGSANIIVRFIFTQWPTGPLFCLAFEISRSKALAHYCFVPFDLRNKTHTKYLSSVFKQGKVELCFLTDLGQVPHIHEIPPLRCAEMMNLYTTAMVHLKTFPDERYDFDRTVSEFEQKIRLVDFFQYAVTDSDLRQLIAFFKAGATKVAPEDRAQAAKLTDELLGIFRPRPEGYLRDLIEKLSSSKRGLLFLSDLHTHFHGASAR